MKVIRGSLRLGSLLLVAVLLIAAMTAPAAASDTKCPKLWDKIEIVSVTAVEPVATWNASDLLSYGDGSLKTSVGVLDITFTPLSSMMSQFDGYRITATPSDDDPGTSDALGIDAVSQNVSHKEAQSAVRMNLEPGTKYFIEVVAVKRRLKTDYILSRAQGNQDDSMGITLLSPPFLGAYTDARWDDFDADANTAITLGPVSTGTTLVDDLSLPNPTNQHQGAHFLVYKEDTDLHGFRWLNPEVFGPFDHVWQRKNTKAETIAAGKEGADILCTDSDGDVDVCGATADRIKKWDINKYRVQITDVDTGTVEYQQDLDVIQRTITTVGTTETDGLATAKYYYEAFFNLANGEYDFSVQAGRLDGSTWRPMSGKAVVRFDITDDYRRYNQSIEEWVRIVEEVAKGIDENDDRERWFDSKWKHYGDSINSDKVGTNSSPAAYSVAISGAGTGVVVNMEDRAVSFIANLNNIYD